MRGLAAVLVCLMLASCAGRQEPPGAPPSHSTVVRSSTVGPATPLPPDPSFSRASAGDVTVRGTVSSGVESGCLVLDTGSTQYLLLGADPAIAVAGARIEVTGRPEPGGMTTCQQGTPFHVESTRRINP
ncbi:hypothetical protein [Lentzea sp. NPDC004782]|uniref:hypothetical protein n=1 Tax=Lentzea sp. NPDC004782 TaxID=3154458 RepID=UPI0033B8644B